MLIHRAAIVHPEARLEPGVEIGAYSVIDRGASVEADTRIGSHVVIGKNVRIGPGCEVYSHAVIGTDPQDLKYDGNESSVEIGEGCKIREFVTVNRGSKAGAATRVGEQTLLMTGSHIAHDCQIGSNVIMANLATLGGHCAVEDHAVLGGMAVAHQFVRIGKMAMVGGTSGLMQDAPPFMMVFGPAPARVVNVNHVGLKRNGVPPEVRLHLRQAFHLLYRQNLSIDQALARIEEELPPSDEMTYLLEFYRTSQRGICRASLQVAEAASDEDSARQDHFDDLTTSIPAT
jgi:UDP-N-acetylglucosamine acyltransferase